MEFFFGGFSLLNDEKNYIENRQFERKEKNRKILADFRRKLEEDGKKIKVADAKKDLKCRMVRKEEHFKYEVPQKLLEKHLEKMELQQRACLLEAEQDVESLKELVLQLKKNLNEKDLEIQTLKVEIQKFKKHPRVISATIKNVSLAKSGCNVEVEKLKEENFRLKKQLKEQEISFKIRYGRLQAFHEKLLLLNNKKCNEILLQSSQETKCSVESGKISGRKPKEVDSSQKLQNSQKIEEYKDKEMEILSQEELTKSIVQEKPEENFEGNESDIVKGGEVPKSKEDSSKTGQNGPGNKKEKEETPLRKAKKQFGMSQEEAERVEKEKRIKRIVELREQSKKEPFADTLKQLQELREENKQLKKENKELKQRTIRDFLSDLFKGREKEMENLLVNFYAFREASRKVKNELIASQAYKVFLKLKQKCIQVFFGPIVSFLGSVITAAHVYVLKQTSHPALLIEKSIRNWKQSPEIVSGKLRLQELEIKKLEVNSSWTIPTQISK